MRIRYSPFNRSLLVFLFFNDWMCIAEARIDPTGAQSAWKQSSSLLLDQSLNKIAPDFIHTLARGDVKPCGNSI